MENFPPYQILKGKRWKMDDELLSVKELAGRLRYSPGYVYAMRRDGFSMPGGRASVRQAIVWLSDHPQFRANKPLGRRAGE